MANPTLKGLLVRVSSPDGAALAAVDPGAAAPALAAQGFGPLEPLFDVAGGDAPGLGAAAGTAARWFRAPLDGKGIGPSPWDAAHRAAAAGIGLAAAGGDVFIEPDFEQAFVTTEPRERLGARGRAGVVDPPNGALPHGGSFAWHLGEGFADLRDARERVADPGSGHRVRIAHLDTGYDPNHVTAPKRIVMLPRANFVRGEARDDPRDPGHDSASPLDNPGHGTGTIGILAGNTVVVAPPDGDFNGFLGGAPEVEVAPVRIASSVIHLWTSAMAEAIEHVATGGPGGVRLADVISLSMGGIASRAWADAVNKAYEAGVCIVAAAGNNFSTGSGGFPTRLIVYPARFRRVIAACGVMADRRPYFGLPMGTMQGCWGPDSKMATAMAAFTPNMPWAERGAPTIIDRDGAGTSSATPQIAAAAALWLTEHRAALAGFAEPWQRVEAVRHALFSSAERTADGGRRDKLGNGILRADAALGVAPSRALAKTPADSASFAFLDLVPGLGAAVPPAQMRMLALEATQLAQIHGRADLANAFDQLVPDPDLPAASIPLEQQLRFIAALAEHPLASSALRMHLEARLLDAGARPPRAPKKARTIGLEGVRPQPRPATRAPRDDAAGAPGGRPAYRRLRGYAIDPSLAQRLDTAPVSTVTFHVPWESLDPGPVGDYLEVIDIDPAARCAYAPVDLDDPRLLAQDGLPASEGLPQFHQQMVYAVASQTIRNFERALGRKSLWRPGPPRPGTSRANDAHFVPRLRIYPHALRGANAYYSPAKIALLFGYYPAAADDPGDHMPNGMVFTCLSHDVIAHETTHALLDGMHRRFIRPTNDDVLAFHEAFADIVALFQHFTLPEILRHQIARTRGEIRSQQNMLGELAGEFGRTTEMGGALRSAIGSVVTVGAAKRWKPAEPDPTAMQTVNEPHARGAILVAAVFSAFLSIYETRSADLLRLATGGSGVLPAAGAISVDLVQRLSAEAAKAAQQVLTMCVRALDYCPPVDLTFGDYLRAIITADADLVRDDDLGYRVAFIEAFRQRGIFPHDVRTLSVDSLRWSPPDHDEFRPSLQLRGGLEKLRDQLPLEVQTGTREQIFHLSRDVRRAMHGWLSDHFAERHRRGGDDADAHFLGIDRAQPFEVHSARVANRVGPDGNLLRQIVLEVHQDWRPPSDLRLPGGGRQGIEGGATIVADLDQLTIQYCVRKRVDSRSRLDRQRAFADRHARSSLHPVYFGAAAEREPVARLHRGA